MKKVYTALKFLAVGIFAVSMTACGSITARTAEPWQGKVWRAKLISPFLDSRGNMSQGAALDASMHFDAKRDTGRRMASVQFSSGWDTLVASVNVPDQIEFSQLKKGAVVDIMAEKGPNNDYSTATFTRILRIVCDASDSACIDKEVSAKRYKTVIDENPPADVSVKYGVTFNRRITQAEADMYK